MGLHVHCDWCDTHREVAPGIIAPRYWKVYKEQGTTLAKEFTLCPSCVEYLEAAPRVRRELAQRTAENEMEASAAETPGEVDRQQQRWTLLYYGKPVKYTSLGEGPLRLNADEQEYRKIDFSVPWPPGAN